MNLGQRRRTAGRDGDHRRIAVQDLDYAKLKVKLQGDASVGLESTGPGRRTCEARFPAVTDDADADQTTGSGILSVRAVACLRSWPTSRWYNGKGKKTVTFKHHQN